jgi:monoamine oxidase
VPQAMSVGVPKCIKLDTTYSAASDSELHCLCGEEDLRVFVAEGYMKLGHSARDMQCAKRWHVQRESDSVTGSSTRHSDDCELYATSPRSSKSQRQSSEAMFQRVEGFGGFFIKMAKRLSMEIVECERVSK